MSNELKDIVEKLNPYSLEKGWGITQATKNTDGSWTITIFPVEAQGASDDNDE